ncbi:MAG: hypothetical protein M5R36_25575 [Deltaproteobacteria bacterium]|nr:hypothetical protein [Deltaproteobacteria bacterium]
MLNEASEARRWQVVNLGQPGFNSSQAATRAIAFLENDSRPVRAVLFNAGKNNEHNLTAARILPREVRELGLRASVAYLLSNSRAFRFGQITLSRLDALRKKPTASWRRSVTGW